MVLGSKIDKNKAPFITEIRKTKKYCIISPHIIRALASEQGVYLGQIKTEDKSNEIKAIPKLLNSISIDNCTITIDAMGYQTEIIETIRNNQTN
ncbi:hypothetical protein [Flavivirga jejuensis]|uniref:DDE family transposase n=1 Tax=Flavivirga jejuensis TaxID=870487 RepID=A0ABT8WRD1_9FLAO|nr:hypothetical protein [Flavivirga jejuensis]MDO5975713.1 hypothetical protein [Flavivirga jejuensis]